MTAYRSRPRPSGATRVRARTRLLVSSAFGALALAGHAGAAHAQAINATPATVAGNVTYSRITTPTPGTETITVETQSAIINWTPPASPPNPYVFLPQGNTVTYQNGINVTDFAVLNRILTNVPSRFDGHVISQIRDPASGLFNSGGTVLFSSPGGIIIGPTAIFDVGNLVLTTLNVVDNSGDFGGTINSFQFDGGSANPKAAVVTLPGSQINATSTNSYLALVAPVVNVGGNARVNGSVGFIAGEALSFTVNAGLFDITVTTGSDNPTPINHSGNTGGPASTGSGDDQRIYMVAVPKNQAITMLLSGNVGYDAATDVTIENGQIVLSAGYDILGGFRTEENPAQDANISITGGTFTSDVVGQASGNAMATASAGSPLDFNQSLQLQAAGRAELIAQAGATAHVGGDLALIAKDATTLVPGTARLEADAGATITIDGGATVSADHLPGGFRDAIVVNGVDRQGGTASVLSQGGTITVGDDLNVTAVAIGGAGTATGGTGTGGTASVEANGGGSVSAAGDINVLAFAEGGASPGLAGNGQGGNARVSGLGGGVSAGSELNVDASAVGGFATGFGTSPGTGTGGTATLEAIGAGGSVAAEETLVVADGGLFVIPEGLFGSSSPTVIGPTGAAQGGTATATVTGGSLTTDQLLVSASAIGRPGFVPSSIGTGTDGFAATGGTAQVQIDGGSVDVSTLLVFAFANGGAGGNGFIGGNGATGTGGRASFTASNITPTIDDLIVAAGGFGGAGGSGGSDDSNNGGPGGNAGDGFGGTAEITIGAGASLTLNVLEVDANGGGGGGGLGGTAPKFGGDGGLGATGTAGSATLRITGGDLTVNSTDGFAVLAEGIGGAGGNGGNSANGPGGVGGDGGNANGGTALVDLTGGSITSFGTFVISSGFGGIAGLGGSGPPGTAARGLAGHGVGGLSRLALADGDSRTGRASLGSTTLAADGTGGDGLNSPSDTAGVTIFDDSASGDITLASLGVSALGGPSSDGRGFAFTSSNGLVTVNGDASIDVTGDVSFAVAGDGGLIVTNPGVGDADLAVVTAGSITIDHQGRTSVFTLAGDSVEFTAQGNVTGNADSVILAGYGDVDIDALGAVDLGVILAAGNVFVDPTSIDIDSVTAGGDIDLDATGNITVGFAQAGDDFTATAGGTFTGGTVISTGTTDNDIDTTAPPAGNNIVIDANGDLRLDNGTAPDIIQLTSRTGSIFSDGTLRADTLLATTAGDLDLNDIFVVSALNLTANSGFIDGNSFNSDGDITLRASNGVTVNGLDTGGSLLIKTAGAVNLGTIVAIGDIIIDPTDITIDSATAGGDISLTASNDISINFAQAGDDFTASAGNNFTGGNVITTGLGADSESGAGPLAGSNIAIVASGDIRLDNGNAADDIRMTTRGGSIFSDGLLTAGSDIFGTAPQDIDVNDADAGEQIFLNAGGFVDTGDVTAGTDVTLLAKVGDVTVASASAGDDFVANAGGAFTGGTVTVTGASPTDESSGALVGNNIVVDANGNVRLDTGTAPDRIELSSTNGSILSAGTLTADTLLADAALDILLNDVFVITDLNLTTPGGSIGGNSFNSNGNINLNAAGTITLASGTAARDITLASGGNTTLGSASAGDDFDASSGGTFTAGTVTATGAGIDSEGGVGALAGSNIRVTATGDLRLDNGSAPRTIGLISSTGSVLSGGTLAGNQLLVSAARDIALNNVNTIAALNLTANNGNVSGNAFTSGGNITLGASGTVTLASATSGGSIAVNAVGDATLGTFVATGRIDTNSATLSFTSATAGTDINLVSSGNMSVGTARAGDDFTALVNNGTFTGGSVTTTGAGTDTEGGAGAFAGSNIFISANGDLRLDNASSPGRIGLGSSTGSILSSGNIVGNRVTAFAARNLALTNVTAVAPLVLTTTNGNITGNVFTSSSDITLTSSGTIGLFRANSGGDVVMRSVGILSLQGGTATGKIDLASSTADVLSGGGGSDSIGSLTAGTDILANAARDVVLGTAVAGNNIDVDAGRNATLGTQTAGNDITVDAVQINVGTATAGRDIRLTGSGTVTVGSATATRNFTATGTAGTFGNLAGASVAVNVVGNARFTGNVSGPAISVTSGDIDIASGNFGNSGTQTVALTVRPSTNPTTLGGSTQGAGYTLTDAEADRIRAATLTITAPATGTAASRPADLQVRDLSLAGAQIGTLRLITPGIAEVNGNLILAGVQTNGGIDIQATERLQIVNPSGSIRVRDGTGLTAGSLSLTSNNIWSATQSILTQLLADSNFAGRDATLLQPSGSDPERGTIEGGTTTLSARDSLFVQNTGSPAVFSGITVRQNTLRIVPTGTSPLRVFAFGRRINPDGSFVTNTAFFREVIFQTRLGTPGFTNDAEFNRCFINSGACAGDNFPGGKDIVDGPVESNVNLGLPVNSDDLVDTSFAQESLIEEPVTSGADSIQWDCDTDDDGDCDEDDVNG